MSAQLQPLQPLHTQPLSQQLQQPPPQQQQHLYLQAAPANSCSPAEQHAAPSTGAPSPAPATFAHTQPPPTAIPYHIYQNVVLAALNSSAMPAQQPITITAVAPPPPPEPQPEPNHHHHQNKAMVAHSIFSDLQIKTEHIEQSTSQQTTSLLPVAATATTPQDLKPTLPPPTATILPSNSALLNPTIPPAHSSAETSVAPAAPAHQQPLTQAAIDPLPTLDPSVLQPIQPVAAHPQQQFMLPLPLSLHQPNAALVENTHQHDDLEPALPGPGKELELPPIEPLLKVKKKRAKKVSSQSGSSSTAAAVGAGGEKLHVCTECPYTCNRADKLKVHVKGVHNNDKPFLCTFCFKGFKQRDKVSRHINTVHYRERPYACDYCPLAFGRKDKVKRHISTVHLGERPYRCNYCSHNTTRLDKMRIHLQQVHQSHTGLDYYIIDRAAQPPPRVLHSNTNRNVGDLITPIAVPPSTPTPAAILPGPISTGVLTSRQPTIVKPEPQEQLDIKPSLLGLPEGIQVTPTSVPSAIATPTTSAVTAIQPQTAVLPPVTTVAPSVDITRHFAASHPPLPPVTAADLVTSATPAVTSAGPLSMTLAQPTDLQVTQPLVTQPLSLAAAHPAMVAAWGGAISGGAEENCSAINNVVPLRIVSKM